MTRLALLTCLSLAVSARAQEPSDGGAEAVPPPAPQMEDREAPPMPGKKPKSAPPAEAPPRAEPKAATPRTEAKPEKPTEIKAEPASPETQGPGGRITVHAYEEDASGVLAQAVEVGMGEQLGGDGRLRYTAKADLLTPPEQAPRLLGEADLQSVDADDALAQGDVEKAKQLLEKALRTYQSYLPQLAARGGGLDPFRDAWMKMARARFFDGDQKGARDAMRFVFVIDPMVKWDPKSFPAAMKKVVVESRLLFDTLGIGALNIDSDPPGATVFLNGKKLEKPTPLEGVPAPPGPNYISYVRRDWVPVSAIFEVAGGGEQGSAVRALEHFPGRPLQPLFRAQKELDKAEVAPTLKEGAAKLGVDLLVLVRVEKGDPGTTRLLAYLYDARPNRILKHAERTTPDDQIGPAAGELAKELTTGVRLDGVWLAPVAPRQPSSSERMAAKLRAFRHWKGFWYVVGGVAGAIVIGTAVGVGVGVGGQKHGLSPGEQLVLIGGN